MDQLELAFERFWSAYPRREAKKPARVAFAKAMKKTTLPVILAALDWQRLQPQWLKSGGDFIPLPATYLNQERWADSPRQSPTLTAGTSRTLSAIFGGDPWKTTQ